MFFIKKIILLITLSILVSYISSNDEYVEIPSTSIRMRVIAKSNSEKDQSDKRIVKDALEKKLYEVISNSDDYGDVDEKLNQKKDEIDETIKQVLINNNIEDNFTSSYGYNYFPEKEFKGITYKSGNYRSYVVTLGEGEGENWWCVLYPPLCLIDENVDSYEYHSLINDVIEKYN